MLGLPPPEWNALVKRTLVLCEGHVRNASQVLGVPYQSLSRCLQHHSLHPWWKAFRGKLSRERAKARTRRYYIREKERALIEAGYDPATAAELAQVIQPRGRGGRSRLPPARPSEEGGGGVGAAG